MFGLILILLIVAIIITNVRIVPQANAVIIERLGKYLCTWEAGLHIKTPFIDNMIKTVNLKEQIADFPPQPVITKDNVTMMIDSVVTPQPVKRYSKVSSPTFLMYVGRKTESP